MVSDLNCLLTTEPEEETRCFYKKQNFNILFYKIIYKDIFNTFCVGDLEQCALTLPVA